MVPPGGYLWWYIDALSDCGRYGLSIIAFVGSVFSPYYAWARRKGTTHPDDFCALNVALYSRGAKRWTMTERSSQAVTQERDTLAIGPSSVRWTGSALEIAIEERDTRLGIPWQRRVSGKVRVIPEALNPTSFALDPDNRHRWHCVAPRARVEVVMDQPGLRWSGSGYLDSNFGSEALAAGRVVEAPVTTQLADGMACRVADPEALAVMAPHIDHIVQVSDTEVAAAMRALFTDTHNVAEGAGAAALAAALQERDQLQGLHVGLALTGGNVDAPMFSSVLAG